MTNKRTRVLKEEERKVMMDFMSQNHNKDFAEVGSFFYDFKNKKLFLVNSIPVEDAPSFDNKKTTRKLHSKVWLENNMKGDYMDYPRGRVFYNTKSKKFEVSVGTWAKEVNALLDLIKIRFNLQNKPCELIFDSCWDTEEGMNRGYNG